MRNEAQTISKTKLGKHESENFRAYYSCRLLVAMIVLGPWIWGPSKSDQQRCPISPFHCKWPWGTLVSLESSPCFQRQRHQDSESFRAWNSLRDFQALETEAWENQGISKPQKNSSSKKPDFHLIYHLLCFSWPANKENVNYIPLNLCKDIVWRTKMCFFDSRKTWGNHDS